MCKGEKVRAEISTRVLVPYQGKTVPCLQIFNSSSIVDAKKKGGWGKALSRKKEGIAAGRKNVVDRVILIRRRPALEKN